MPKEVKRLVERFRENREAYLSSEYNETQIRREFLDPFFKTLGWDVDNEQGYAEAYKDVIHEDAIKVGGATKAPDYAFRIGGTRKFFVEAKRPSVGIKDDPAAAYQLRRYAWSAKLPLSILTDFEEFAVYDCRVRPCNGDKASTARTLYFTYGDYETEWDKIAGIFSPESIRKGSFDKYAEAKKKRGTAEVDDVFLDEIERWRELLARNIALRNTQLSNREVNFAVQRTVDRIIFLRICEDRGIEEYGQLMALRNGTDVYQRLCEVFRNADDRYNSGLFHFREEKDRGGEPDGLTLGLEIDDGVLKGIFKDLYYPESPYEFSVLPADILGHIYEQFLGKVIRLTPAHRAVVEEKPEVRKAGGVYYTPTYIVGYIVEHTVGKLLEDKTPNRVAKLRVLDPACGSGSFLLGAYQRLLDWHLAWYSENEPEKHAKGRKPKVFRGPGGDWRLTTAEKKRILLNNIYGVDIDPQAVEVTKLSLLLKVLEGESAETLGKSLRLFRERALPDLGENIKCGNSLIGPDFYEGKQLSLIDEEERYRINAFDWDAEFPEIMGAGGFDAVIGNPPYGARFTAREKRYLQDRFIYRKGKPESYIFFMDKGLSLLHQDGMLGYITPNAWLTNYYGVQFRRYVLETAAIAALVDLEPTRVFYRAVVDTSIAILTKQASGRKRMTQVFRAGEGERIEPAFRLHQKRWLQHPDAVISLSATPTDMDLLAHLEDSQVTLNDVAEYSQGVIPYKTREEGQTNACISASKRGAEWRPLIEGASQVVRYHVEEPSAYIRYGPWLSRERDVRFFANDKILFHRVRKKLPRQLVGGLDRSGAVNRHSLSNLILRAGQDEFLLAALLGIFNSAVANWWFVSTYGLLMEVGGFKVARIPLPSQWPAEAEELASRVQRITDLSSKRMRSKTGHERNTVNRQIDATDKRIDQLVYELYGLTDKETRIVEEATSM